MIVRMIIVIVLQPPGWSEVMIVRMIIMMVLQPPGWSMVKFGRMVWTLQYTIRTVEYSTVPGMMVQ